MIDFGCVCVCVLVSPNCEQLPTAALSYESSLIDLPNCEFCEILVTVILAPVETGGSSNEYVVHVAHRAFSYLYYVLHILIN